MLYELKNPKQLEKETVNKLQKDVFGKRSFIVFVHADWCGHCVRMLPEWNKFAEKAKNDANFDIIDISSDSHSLLLSKKLPFISELLHKTVRGYPTIFMVSQSNSDSDEKMESKVEFFEDERTAGNLSKFVRKNLPKKGVSKNKKVESGLKSATSSKKSK